LGSTIKKRFKRIAGMVLMYLALMGFKIPAFAHAQHTAESLVKNTPHSPPSQIPSSKSTLNKKKVVLEVVKGRSKAYVSSISAQTTMSHSNSQVSNQAMGDLSVEKEVEKSWKQLLMSLQGAKLDSLIMLAATSVVIPLFKRLNTSPIVGFLLTGTLLGPRGLNCIRDVHTIDALGELGIVFFLFEMGLELSLERLKVL
jgi:hypothetical protein